MKKTEKAKKFTANNASKARQAEQKDARGGSSWEEENLLPNDFEAPAPELEQEAKGGKVIKIKGVTIAEISQTERAKEQPEEEQPEEQQFEDKKIIFGTIPPIKMKDESKSSHPQMEGQQQPAEKQLESQGQNQQPESPDQDKDEESQQPESQGQSQLIKQPESRGQNQQEEEVITLSDVLNKASRMFEAANNLRKVEDLAKQLNSFEIGREGQEVGIELTDKNGNKFKTANTYLCEAVLKTLKEEVAKKARQLEQDLKKLY